MASATRKLASLGTAFVLTGFLVVLPAGYLADRYVRTRIIAVVLASWGVISGLNALVRSFWQFLLVRATLGIGETVDNPASQSLIADYYRADVRGRAFALQRATPFFGQALGLGLAGWVGRRLGLALGLPVGRRAGLPAGPGDVAPPGAAAGRERRGAGRAGSPASGVGPRGARTAMPVPPPCCGMSAARCRCARCDRSCSARPSPRAPCRASASGPPPSTSATRRWAPAPRPASPGRSSWWAPSPGPSWPGGWSTGCATATRERRCCWRVCARPSARSC